MGRQSLNITLLFPPKSDITQPHLCLPSLKAYLGENGYPDVIQRDLGIEAYDFLVSGEHLQKAFDKVCLRFNELENLDKLNYKQAKEYNTLARSILCGSYVWENIDRAKQVLRSPTDFFDPGKHGWALDLLTKANDLLSAEFYPTKITEYTFTMEYSCQSSREILAAVDDRQTNMFRQYFSDQVVPGIKPGLVGISIVYLDQVIPALTLAALVKSQFKSSVHIVVGGSIFTRLKDNLQRLPHLFDTVDSFVIGEGEIALLELVRQLEGDADLSRVPNLVYRRDNRVVVNDYAYVKDMNQLPTPCFDGLLPGKYLIPYPVIYLQTGRGCYWKKCAFCDIPFFQDHYHHGCYRGRKASLLNEDMGYLSGKFKTRYFAFWDEAAFPGTLRELSSLLVRGRQDMRWYAQIRFEKAFTPRLCSGMFKAGCRHVSFGFESGSRETLIAMKKGTNKKLIREVLRNFYEAGIGTAITWFMGFPTETRGSVEETLEFIKENRKYIDCADVPGRFVLLKHSGIEQNTQNYGISKIIDEQSDMAIAFKYVNRKGMSMLDTLKVQESVIEKMKSLGYSEGRFGAYYLLYQDYYRQKLPPYSFSLNNTFQQDIKETGILTRVPGLNQGVSIAYFNFDLKYITKKTREKWNREQELILEKLVDRESREQILENETPAISPAKSFTLYNIHSGRMVCFGHGSDVITLVSLCDRRRTLKEIIEIFAVQKKISYNHKLENQCMQIFKYLVEKSFVHFEVNPGE